MKKAIATIAALLVVAPVLAGEVGIGRKDMGSGVPGATGVEQATSLGNGVYHAPQYLPGFPTASTIFPRVVEVECVKQPSGSLDCAGYNWSPEMGRAEYLLVRPIIKEPVKPVVVEKVVPVEVIKEVPAKN